MQKHMDNEKSLVQSTDVSLHFACLQNSCMSQPVVYLDNMLDLELASKLTTIILKHQVICCNDQGEQINRPVLMKSFRIESHMLTGCSLCGWMSVLVGSQFLLPQGTVTDDRILASHHVFPLTASPNDGQLNSNLSSGGCLLKPEW